MARRLPLNWQFVNPMRNDLLRRHCIATIFKSYGVLERWIKQGDSRTSIYILRGFRSNKNNVFSGDQEDLMLYLFRNHKDKAVRQLAMPITHAGLKIGEQIRAPPYLNANDPLAL